MSRGSPARWLRRARRPPGPRACRAAAGTPSGPRPCRAPPSRRPRWPCSSRAPSPPPSRTCRR
ncbi:MAG: hypothetical protein DMD65_14010 [Gemmatimonadetes bacterium]|nr:MAG: hypothetical protein DMD65_14010 [Gemmatimonadota bacterium]